MEFKVQRAGINGTWKTVCENRNESYAREIYLVDPNGCPKAKLITCHSCTKRINKES